MKGFAPPGVEPVLKGKTQQWLAQRDASSAFCEAPKIRVEAVRCWCC